MRLVVTGGSGYIGTELLRALLTRDDVEEVVVVDLRPPRLEDPRVRFVERSVTEDLRGVLADPRRPVDVAMHLAWVVDPLRDAARQRAICIDGTRRFLDGCAAGEVGHVFFMSSATAYGAHPDHATPRRETDELRAEHHFQYSAEKREAEGLCAAFARERRGTLLQIARPAIVGGPNVSNFIFRMVERLVVFRAMGHDPELQIVHEDDVAAALVAIVTSRAPGAFNIAADDAMRLSAIIAAAGRRTIPVPLPILRAAAGAAWRLGLSGVTEAPGGFVNFSVYPWLVSNARLREALGWSPRHTTRDTIAAFLRARASSSSRG